MKLSTKVSLKFSRAKLQQKFENLTNFQQPNEALGLSTYTTEASNNFLKIREAWLPKLEINISYPPLARLPPSALIWLFVLQAE